MTGSDGADETGTGGDEADGALEGLGFDWRATRDGTVFVTWRGRTVRTFAGDEAARLLRRLEGADPGATQLALAKATRNFKRGNERG